MLHGVEECKSIAKCYGSVLVVVHQQHEDITCPNQRHFAEP
jgi:hypothetical protein